MPKKREHNGHTIFGASKCAFFGPKNGHNPLKNMFYDGGLYLE